MLSLALGRLARLQYHSPATAAHSERYALRREGVQYVTQSTLLSAALCPRVSGSGLATTCRREHPLRVRVWGKADGSTRVNAHHLT